MARYAPAIGGGSSAALKPAVPIARSPTALARSRSSSFLGDLAMESHAYAQARRHPQRASVVTEAMPLPELQPRRGAVPASAERCDVDASPDNGGGFGGHLQAAATFATPEHFNLQTARAATISEANGRATIYLAALSSSLIALAFIGQMSRVGPAFHAFALIALPVLAFIGVVTFERLVQLSFEDIAYAERIGRLREFYVTVAPGLAPYVLVVRGPSAQASLNGGAPRPTGWQLALTTAGMIAVVNSVVLASCAGLLLRTLGIGSLGVILAAGAIVGAAALSIQRRHQRRARDGYAPEAVDRASIQIPRRPTE